MSPAPGCRVGAEAGLRYPRAEIRARQNPHTFSTGCGLAGTYKERTMPKIRLTVGIAVGFAICAGVVSGTRAFQAPAPAVAVDNDDLAGTVTGPSGPEAGVWVIAETRDLPTPFAKIVVTDDRGRYLLPDLPRASYSVFVRGYGLVDSPRTQGTPGRTLDLKAVPASSP